MVALILSGSVVGAQTLARTSAVSNRLSDRIAPARTAVVQLDVALRDQEAGAVAQGRAELSAAAAELRGLLTDQPDILAELASIESLAARPTDLGALRARVDALDQRLVTEREEARAALQESRDTRDTIFLGMTALLLAFIVGIAVLLRVTVLSPLARLSTAVRQVADGDFEHRLTPHGPADVAQLGRDVEAMRHRLVEGLTASRQATAALELSEAELRRSNADLEQFAYVASHDLQEPLRKVASFCQMLQRRYAGSLDDRAQQYIAFAVDGATRMQRLINDLLTFSRIGRVDDSIKPVDLDQVVDEVLALRVAGSGAEITRPDLPTVPGNPTLLTMLWQNLLSNAIKFRHPDRTPRVEITVDEGADLWTFRVRDNGIGIEPEFADKVFVIFQRLHPRESYDGTGIGLALCKKVVEHHGGTIRLDTEVRDGACLEFTLPR